MIDWTADWIVTRPAHARQADPLRGAGWHLLRASASAELEADAVAEACTLTVGGRAGTRLPKIGHSGCARDGVRRARRCRAIGRDRCTASLFRRFRWPAGLRLGEPGDRHRLAARPRTGHADAASVHRDAAQPLADRSARRHARRREDLHAARVQARSRAAALARRRRRRRPRGRVARQRVRARWLEARSMSRMAALDASVFGARRASPAGEFPRTRREPWFRAVGRERLRPGACGPSRLLPGAGGGSERARCHRADRRRDRVHPRTASSSTSPMRKRKIAACLGEHGFRVQRPLLRMALGRTGRAAIRPGCSPSPARNTVDGRATTRCCDELLSPDSQVARASCPLPSACGSRRADS